MALPNRSVPPTTSTVAPELTLATRVGATTTVPVPVADPNLASVGLMMRKEAPANVSVVPASADIVPDPPKPTEAGSAPDIDDRSRPLLPRPMMVLLPTKVESLSNSVPELMAICPAVREPVCRSTVLPPLILRLAPAFAAVKTCAVPPLPTVAAGVAPVGTPALQLPALNQLPVPAIQLV
jgi:hypothetical protein